MKTLPLFLVVISSLLFAPDFQKYSLSADKVVIRPSKTINVPADASTIQIAVDGAAEGDIINIAAGSYNEKITISRKNITLQGAGRDTTSISAGTSDAIISVDGPVSCTIKNLSVQGGNIGVYCGFGAAVINNCRLQNNVYSGIYARYNSFVYLINSDVNGNGIGVVISRHSSIYTKGSNIFSNSQNGLEAEYTSTARIESCDIHDNGGNGIDANSASSIRLSLSNVHGNSLSGAGVSGNSSIALRGGNQIYANADNSGWRAGIVAAHSSSIALTQTDSGTQDDIYGNHGPGIHVSNGSSLFIKNGKVRNNDTNGINLQLNSSAQLETASITSNAGYGIDCSAQSIYILDNALTVITGNTGGDSSGCP